MVVTIYTAGAAAAWLAGAAAPTSLAAAATAATAYGTGISMAAGAIGAAVGSIVSQGVGIAVGAQESFSWKQVAQSAVGGAISGGMTAAYGQASLAGSGIQNTFVRAAVSNAIGQGVGMVVGWQKNFSWTAMAGAVVGAVAGSVMNDALSTDDALAGPTQDGSELTGKGDSVFGDALGSRELGNLARGTLSGIVSGFAVSEVHGGHMTIGQVATDAFGNALGSSIADGVQPEVTKSFSEAPAPIDIQAYEPIEVLQPIAEVELADMPDTSGFPSGVNDPEDWRPRGGMRNVMFRDGPMGPATDADGFRRSAARSSVASDSAIAGGGIDLLRGPHALALNNTELDRWGQPLNGRSNFDRNVAIGRVLRSEDSLLTKAAQLFDLVAIYTVPDADQLGREINARWTSAPNADLARIDRMEGAPFAGILGGLGYALDARNDTLDMLVGVGTATEGLALSRAVTLGRVADLFGTTRPGAAAAESPYALTSLRIGQPYPLKQRIDNYSSQFPIWETTQSWLPTTRIYGDRPNTYNIYMSNGNGLLSDISAKGILEIAVCNDVTPKVLSGKQMFAQMMRHYGDRVTGIEGNWSNTSAKADNLNLGVINKLTADGVPLEIAVTKTWTADRALNYGFTQAQLNTEGIRGTPGKYTRVEVLFTKPDPGATKK